MIRETKMIMKTNWKIVGEVICIHYSLTERRTGKKNIKKTPQSTPTTTATTTRTTTKSKLEERTVK